MFEAVWPDDGVGGRWAAGGAELCQLDKYGGVGAFAQFGVKDAAVKPKKWSRIVTTVKLGREQVTNTTAHKRLSLAGLRYHIAGLCSHTDGGVVSQGMTTYVAGAKGVVQCAQVRSNYFVPSDGGLLLSKTKMRVLFVSLTPS